MFNISSFSKWFQHFVYCFIFFNPFSKTKVKYCFWNKILSISSLSHFGIFCSLDTCHGNILCYFHSAPFVKSWFFKKYECNWQDWNTKIFLFDCLMFICFVFFPSVLLLMTFPWDFELNGIHQLIYRLVVWRLSRDRFSVIVDNLVDILAKIGVICHAPLSLRLEL